MNNLTCPECWALGWVTCFDTTRPHGTLGDVTPAEYEAA